LGRKADIHFTVPWKAEDEGVQSW